MLALFLFLAPLIIAMTVMGGTTYSALAKQAAGVQRAAHARYQALRPFQNLNYPRSDTRPRGSRHEEKTKLRVSWCDDSTELAEVFVDRYFLEITLAITEINNAAWGLDATNTDEKVARTRAVIILLTGRLIYWDHNGLAQVQDERGEWVEWMEGENYRI